jgi:tRNA(Ile)-lysidine synthase
MLPSFRTYIAKENLFNPSETILLTVSGGVDSVVMCDLFHKAGFHFAIAHCNFQLRGSESNGDAAFVKNLAKKYKVEFHSIEFETSVYAKKNKLSTQVAARELRYEWFEKIRKKHRYHYIATAHHLDDSIETFFINLLRGAGVSGLHGILPKYNYIIRPMLFCGKTDIVNYAKKNKLTYREDSSNASDKYVRNKIRHQVIPVLKEINPQLENTINNNMMHLREVELIYKNEIEKQRKKIVTEEKDVVFISIKSLKKVPAPATFLFEFLKPYNFNESIVNEITSVLDGESGKRFFSPTHRLIKDREFLIVENKVQSLKIQSPKFESPKLKVKKNQKEIVIDKIKLTFSNKSSKLWTLDPKLSTSIAQLDFDKLEFPLQIRKWQQGDTFHPLGMKGQKKVSDFFIDKKFSVTQKENTWLLISNDKIAWIIGHRIDDRFKITDKTKTIYIAELV